VAILPYYVANLNIEATYAAIMGEYEEYPSLCFVDTLDNVEGLRKHAGHIDDLFGGMSDINIKRIREQNSRRISVVIGNPPYNANQLNENENNKNREYPQIDKRIKETYIAASTAQKTKLYDMYARFFRWASDRLDQNGILAFVTNRSFVEMRTFDGFRAVLEKEFNEVYVVDLGGDVRANPKLSGSKHNVFGIQTGVAISFMVKRAKAKGSRLHYFRRPEMETAEEKLAFLSGTKLSDLPLDEISSDKSHNWINLSSNDFDSLLPIASREGKFAKGDTSPKSIFKVFSLGVITARDEWVYSDNRDELANTVKHLVSVYEADRLNLSTKKTSAEIDSLLDTSIKWSRTTKRDLKANIEYEYDASHIRESLYRPYVKRWLYFHSRLNEMQNRMTTFFPAGIPSPAIMFSDAAARAPFTALVCNIVPEYHLAASSDGFQCLPFLYFDEVGNSRENVTDWAVAQFRKQYEKGTKKPKRPITKESIFHYVYAVLHDPIYREKYAQNLKREFPRIPFYENFWQWADWGMALMDLHIGYESVKPAKLKRTDVEDEKAKKAGLKPKPILKADKEAGTIVLDSETKLEGIPPEAWDYRLGNRSALEWILDQYKESKPKDPTIREKFDTYRFADYKEKVIDLLERVTTVSVETQRIVSAMRKAER